MISDTQADQLREGDVVLVRAVVRKPLPSSAYRNVGLDFLHEGSGSTIHYVQAAAIVSVEAKALAIGDRVYGSGTNPGKIVATFEDKAWVRWDGRHNSQPDGIKKLADLTRASE